MSIVSTRGGIPLYANGTAPTHLVPVSHLERVLHLELAPGQQPEAYVHAKYVDWCGLYDPAKARPKPDTIGAAWARRVRRTCPRCGEVRGYVIDGRQCWECSKADRERVLALQARTCRECGRVGRRPYRGDPENGSGRYCGPCRAVLSRKAAEALAKAVFCPDCETARTSTFREVRAWLAEGRARRMYYRQAAGWSRRPCPPCAEVRRVEAERRQAEYQATAERRAEEERRRRAEAKAARVAQLQALGRWAGQALADPEVRILDSETTGLHDEARVVELAVITTGGEIVLDTLLNPGEPIPAEASDIHGITDADVAGAPTFAAILPQLTAALHGRRVLIYNAPYDLGRLQHELGLALADETDPAAAAKAWLDAVDAEDAMIPYSDWVGDYSSYWGNNRWQPLNGGHRAAGDCLAVIERLREMTAAVDPAAVVVYDAEDYGEPWEYRY